MTKKDEMDKMDFYDIFPLVIVAFLIIVVIVLSASSYTGSYEYETIDGEKGIAVYCEAFRGVPYCALDDGTAVYGIKKYKKVAEEEE
jgi:hypothetical protein